MLQIKGNDIVGCERHVTQTNCLRIVYVPLGNPAAAKPIRKVTKTPWLMWMPQQETLGSGRSIRDLASCIDSCVPRKRFLIIINPKSGPGHAEKLVDAGVIPLLQLSGSTVEKRVTEAPKHATSIVREIQPKKYDCILCAGGDGTFHEILQGVLDRPDWKDMVDSVDLLQVPCGSGNGLAASSGIWNIASAVHSAIHGVRTKLDVASILQPATGKRIFSFLSVTYGMVANLDIGTEHLRWMGGTRFVWGAIREILGQKTYMVNISFVEQEKVSKLNDAAEVSLFEGPPLLILSKYVLQSNDGWKVREAEEWTPLSGHDVQLCVLSNVPWLDMNFNLAPHAKVDNGAYNLLYTIGKRGISRGLALLGDAEKGKHMHLVDERCVSAFRVEPLATNTWLVVDGEAIDMHTIYGEVHPGLCRILAAR